jgi:hypothetical protein
VASLNRRFGRQTKRNDINEAPQPLVIAIGLGVDAAESGKCSQPKVTLAFTGTEEEITPLQLLVEKGSQMGDYSVALPMLTEAGILEMERVVDVGDDDLVGLRQKWMGSEQSPLHDENVHPRRPGTQPFIS